MPYWLQFIDRAKFISSSLSGLVNNLAEGVHKIKCKNEHDNEKYEKCGIKYKDYDCFFEDANFKNDLMEYKYLCCNKNYQEKFDENFKKLLFNIYKFSNSDINNFILLLRKCVYPC